MTFGVAFAVMVAATWAGVAVGHRDSYWAATPATCGDAIDEPFITWLAESLVAQSEAMSAPGANRSRQVPTLENGARASPASLAPTTSACVTRDGEARQESAPLP